MEQVWSGRPWRYATVMSFLAPFLEFRETSNNFPSKTEPPASQSVHPASQSEPPASQSVHPASQSAPPGGLKEPHSQAPDRPPLHPACQSQLHTLRPTTDQTSPPLCQSTDQLPPQPKRRLVQPPVPAVRGWVVSSMNHPEGERGREEQEVSLSPSGVSHEVRGHKM